MSKLETAVFGGGCFWCTEAIFQRLRGISSVVPGYAGGSASNPSYFRVSEGLTGHAEVIKIEFDPQVITYTQLLDIFFHTHNPTTLNQQGADTGTQYRSVIFYTSAAQHQAAQKIKAELSQTGEFASPIVTKIEALDQFYTAEEYHQNYFNRNQTQPYCDVVISPKIHTLLSKYAHLVKPEYKKV